MAKLKVERAASDIQRELSNILLLEAKDVDFKRVTITAVEVSNDFSYAKVFFTTTSDMDHKEVEKNLNDDTAGYLRTLIANRIDIRHTPKLRFVFDNSIDYGTKIEKLIEEIHEKDGE